MVVLVRVIVTTRAAEQLRDVAAELRFFREVIQTVLCAIVWMQKPRGSRTVPWHEAKWPRFSRHPRTETKAKRKRLSWVALFV